jgi:K+-transporting ATPase ATPase A chain
LTGGTGSGLYGMLLFAILSVFIAGLMVANAGDLGKKIQGPEMKLVVLYILSCRSSSLCSPASRW